MKKPPIPTYIGLMPRSKKHVYIIAFIIICGLLYYFRNDIRLSININGKRDQKTG